VSRRSSVLLAGLVAAAAALLLLRPPAAPRPSPRTGGDASPDPRAARGALRAPATDPATIRDVFRFAPGPGPGVAAQATPGPPPAAAAPAIDPARPRLVGLVRRQGVLLAAFAVGEDVVLAGAGGRAGGLSVLDVGEDGVLVRFADGSEERLPLP
jgi:hypothetical protein